jgi:hypothetical protein
MPKKMSLQTYLTKSAITFLGIYILLLSKAFAGTTPPVTTKTVEPSDPDGKNGWYVHPVKITLTGTDLESGIKEINYKIDDANWTKKDFSNSLNLAPNPSFENSSANPPLNTQDWKISTSDPGGDYSRDYLVYKPEFPSTSVKIVGSSDNWHAIDHYDMFAAATSYNTMSAYAWIKTLNISGSAYFNVYSISQSGTGPKTVNFVKSSPVVTGTNDWTKISTNFTPTSDNVIGIYLEIGFLGTGTIWIDAVNISKSDIPTTAFYVSTDGNHTVDYYAVDKAGNIETTKSGSFKIDQTPPGNWKDSGAVRSLLGNAHQLYMWTNVEDKTSGLSVFTDKFQYFIPGKSTGFGRYPLLGSCSGNWQSGGWGILVSPPFSPGVKEAYLITPMVDFCNSEWHKACHYVRFYAEDMAGNSSTRDMCINGPWIRVRGEGIVRANQNIDMIAEVPSGEYNTDGLIEVGEHSINFFNSSKNIAYYEAEVPEEYDYQKFFDTVRGEKTQISTSGNLISSSGIYYINGNYEISGNKIPSNYSTSVFNQIVFVNGNLTISSNIAVSKQSTTLFIVKGNVNIDEDVTAVSVGLISDQTIDTAYNFSDKGKRNSIEIKGILIANKVAFKRSLQGTGNKKFPAEDITYEPKYVLKMSDYIGNNTVKWVYSD